MEERKKRLQHLVKSYKSDFDAPWKAYTDLCAEHGETPAALLTDASLYDDEKGIMTVSMIQRQIKRFTNRLRNRVEGVTTPEAKRQKLENDLAQREANYSARQNHVCAGCGNNKMICLYGGAWPHIPAFVAYSDLSLEICIECGKVYGFDKAAVRAALNREEIDNLGDDDGIDESDY